MEFKKAERKKVKLKLGISGPSGSGKTFSALKIAKGLLNGQGKIALIDTENRSASLYADTASMPVFDTLELDPPYTVEKYTSAIEAAIRAGYDILVVDSVSHVWSGEGGLLQDKEAIDARGGNSYTNWAKMTPKWNKFVSTILHSDIHMVCTMRSKQDYVLTQNDKGKQVPQKVGMAPQVREGFEYELTGVFDMDMSHQAQASKDRTGLFDGRIWKPDEKTGAEIAAWLAAGKTTEPVIKPAPLPDEPKSPTKDDLAMLNLTIKRAGWTNDGANKLLKDRHGVERFGQINLSQFNDILKHIDSHPVVHIKVDESFAKQPSSITQEPS